MSNIAKILEKVNGATFASIDSVTIPVLKGGKANPMKGNVRKIMTGATVMLFTNKKSSAYDNMVKRRLTEEGKDPESFHLGNRSWGTRLENTPIVHHNKDGVDKYYLEVVFMKSGNVHYEVNGVVTPVDQIQGLETDKEEGHQGGLDNKVVIRTFEIKNLLAIRAFGEEYRNLSYVLE